MSLRLNGPVRTAFQLPPERCETPPSPSFVIPSGRDTDFIERDNIIVANYLCTLTSMVSLASTYSDQGRLDEAETLGVQVVEMSKAKLGVDHQVTLMSMNNLAATYRDQGRLDEAETLGVQVVEMSKAKLGADHPDTLASMHNLAATYRDQGRLDEAETLGVQVVEMSKTKLGADHPVTLMSMADLALTRSDSRCYSLNEEVFKKASSSTRS
ncbi:hypothetical protein ACJBU6_07299 [Exserohilum turcicum]